MSSRKVYMDYGIGEQDISTFVRDDLVIDNKAFSDDYKYAQNIANFTVNYDYTLYSGLKNATTDIKTRIIETDNGINPQGTVVPSGLLTWYSFDDMPSVPDGASPDYRSNFTAGVDGWGSLHDVTLSVANGTLTWTNIGGDPYAVRLCSSFSGTGKYVYVRFRQIAGTLATNVSFYSPDYAKSQSIAYTSAGLGVWQIISGPLTEWAGYSITNVRIDWPDYGTTTGCILEISDIYIGDGTYATGWPYDNSGNGNSGVACGGVVPCEGVSNDALMFNGSSGSISLDITKNSFTGAFTFSAWVQGAAGRASTQYLFVRSGSAVPTRGIRLAITSANLPYFYISDNGTNQVTLTADAGAECTADCLLQFVFIPSVAMYIYKNGTLIKSQTMDVPALAHYMSSQVCAIGSYSLLSRYFGGWMDEVRIYTRALTDSEISYLYNARDVFTGIIPRTLKYTYNGILDNIQIPLEAVDNSAQLDKRCSDIIYREYYVMNSSDIAHSIVHQLAYLAGYTEAQIDGNIHIHTIVEAFSPPSEDESILTLLNVFLYEYGYALSFNASGQISPIKWNTTDSYLYQFDDTNIIESIERTEKPVEYEGVEITYNELGERSNILLYREDLPYNSTGGFSGYALTSGYFYPAEANGIDDTTGKNQVVDYVYTDESIKYFTNKAVVKGITEQYSYKAFSSDFSSIVATSGHYLNWNADRKTTDGFEGTSGDVYVVTSGYDVVIDGVNVPTYYFGNKKARVIVNNRGATSFLYYMNINGDVLYRTADRKLLMQNVANTTKIDKYTANFLFNATDVTSLATGMAKEYQMGNTQYDFKSAVNAAAGTLVKMYMDDGTNQDGVVLEKRFSEQTGLYDYTVKSRSTDRGALTQKRISRYSNSTRQVYMYKGTTIIVAASGYQGYDAHYFCTGANDDMQIQAAIDYLSATFGGGTIQLTTGVYNCSTKISLKAGIKIIGTGNSSQILTTSNIDLIEVSDINSNISYCRLTGKDNASYSAVKVSYTDFSINHCRIENALTINALRCKQNSNNIIASTAGTYIAGTDLCEISSGTCIVAASGYTGEYTLKCNGADDNEQIQAAIDYLFATFGGGTVQLTTGVYNCSTKISIKAGIKLIGEGDSSQILTTSNIDLIEVSGINSNISYCRLTGKDDASYSAVKVSYTDFNISHCKIENVLTVNALRCKQSSNNIVANSSGTYINGTDLSEISTGNIVVAASTYTGEYTLKCNGADDNEQIQAAIDYLSATFGGGTVQLTTGTYNLTTKISIKAGIKLIGGGDSSQIITTSNIELIEITGVNASISYCRLTGKDDASYCAVKVSYTDFDINHCKIENVLTINALRCKQNSNNIIASTAGTYIAGTDLCEISSGTCIVAASGYTGEYTLKCNGADDNEQIQATIDYLSATFSGGTVQLTAGVYNITTKISIKAGIKLIGGGDSSQILTTSNIDLIEVSGINSNISYCRLTGKDDASYSAVKVSYTDFSINHCRIENALTINALRCKQSSNNIVANSSGTYIAGTDLCEISSGNTVVAASTYTGEYTLKCDGTADDVQIQAAIDYLSATFGGGIVVLTAGVYNISTKVKMCSYVTLKGQGISATTLERDGNIYGVEAEGSLGNELQNFTLSEFSLINKTGNTSLLPLYKINYAKNFNVSTTAAYGAQGTGYQITYSENASINDSYCSYCGLQYPNMGYGGFVIAYCESVSIINSSAYNIGNPLETSGAIGIWLYLSTGCSVISCATMNNITAGITISISGKCRISDCSSYDNKYYGLRLNSLATASGSWNSTIVNNQFYRNASGIEIGLNSCNNTFTGNAVFDNTSMGIRIMSFSSNNIVDGNNVNDNGANGIVIYDASSIKNIVIGNRSTGHINNYTDAGTSTTNTGNDFT